MGKIHLLNFDRRGDPLWSPLECPLVVAHLDINLERRIVNYCVSAEEYTPITPLGVTYW